MRATKSKHYYSAEKTNNTKETSTKRRKGFKAISFVVAVSVAVAILIIPTTTLAPGVDAFENSKVASFSVGNIDEFSIIITDNCVVPTTVPVTQAQTEAVEGTTDKSAKATKTSESSKEEKKNDAETSKVESKSSSTNEVSETLKDYSSNTTNNYASSSNSSNNSSSAASDNSSSNVSSSGSFCGNALISIANPDSSYAPRKVNLSAYDRAKLERLVMGEIGGLGYTASALVAQCIRDAMNRSNTSSIDRIISEYGYYGRTTIEPNSDVKNAVSFIFDQNGSAVQHRVLCFYTGQSAWHETQNFVTAIGSNRFFDLWY